MSKKLSSFVLALVLLAIAAAFFLGAACSRLPLASAPAPAPDPDFALLQEVWEVFHQRYVELDLLDADTMLRGAVKGMVDAIDDPYSAYLDPEQYDISISGLSGKFEGIGAWVGDREGRIIIIAPIPDSPADRAGIRPGDTILAIDGEPTAGISIMDAVRVIRGPQGTPVTLLILHEDEDDPVEIKIIRAEIKLPSVHLEMIEDIAHLTITNFSDRTATELSEMLEQMAEEGATAIVLDLRRNPGGLLEAVVSVAGRFLEEGVVVSVIDNAGNKRDSTVVRDGPVITLPMAVLVDEFSASGSEVLSGALQDYDRAVVAGTTTFGKGSVNILHQLSDGSGVYVTIARWYTPSGRLIEGEGIEPDVELDPEVDALDWAVNYLKSHL